MAKRKINSQYGITTPRGFRAAGGTCGIKESGQPDLMMIAAERPASAAGVFTSNKVKGAPVVVSMNHLRRPMIQGVVCNSGNANVGTGKQGLADAKLMCKTASKSIGAKPSQVLVCSTGIIGVPLPMELITKGIDRLGRRLVRSTATNRKVAKAILTTDLVTKQAFRRLRIGNSSVNLAGIAKGSGMIAPNMATMLAFITTDAAVTPKMLRQALRKAAQCSFNRICVDMDQSTSDSAIVLASGAAKHKPIDRRSKRFDQFQDALSELCRDLAHQIVQDGEGATRVFRVVVCGARSVRDADLVGKTVVGSPLVKTAVHGADPNWGRIIAAAGRSGAAFDPLRICLSIGDQQILRAAQPIELTRSDLRNLTRAMRQPEVTFILDLRAGKHRAEWLGCDLSKQYVTINADYTT